MSSGFWGADPGEHSDSTWKNGRMRTVCAGRGCLLLQDGYLEYVPAFCLCSRGWVKAVFGEALGEEVEVELVQAIGSGDECYEFSAIPMRGGGRNER